MHSNEVGMGLAQNPATYAADPLSTGQAGAHIANHSPNALDPNIAAAQSGTGAGTSVVGEFLVSNEIGRGSFATVYLGRSKSTGRLVAVKSVARDRLNRKLAENLESEIRILKGIQHEHIVGLYDIVKTSRHIHLIMEYCSMGDLSRYIKKRGQVPGMMDLVVAGTNATGASSDNAYNQAAISSIAGPWGGLNEAVARHFLHQIVAAIEFLRSHSLIHRDLKPQNLLLSPPPQGTQHVAIPISSSGRSYISPTSSSPPTVFNVLMPVIKLADFGFARTLLQQSLASTLCGSPLYMAPEILRGDRYDAKADLWSLGTVLYELVAGRPPFKAQNHVELLRKIERGEGVVRFPGDEKPNATRRSTDEMNLDPRNRTSAVTIPKNNLQYTASHGSPSGTSSVSTATIGPPPVSEDIKDLIQGLLKRNPLERIGFEELFMHPAVLQPAKLSVLGASPGTGSTSQRRSVAGVKPTLVGSFNSRPSSNPIGNQRVPSQRGSFPPEERTGSSPKYSHGMVVNHEDEPLPSQSHLGKRQSTGRSPDVVLVSRETPFGQQSNVRPGPVSEESSSSAAHAVSLPDRHQLSPGSTESLDEYNYAGGDLAANMGLSLDDYVVVEKRTVEVNWIADEVAASDKDERIGKPSSSSGLSSGRVLGTLRNHLFGTPPQAAAPVTSKQSQLQVYLKGSPALPPAPSFARQPSSRQRVSTATNTPLPPSDLSSSPTRNEAPNIIAEDPASLLRTLKNCTESAILVNSLAKEALAIARGVRNNTAAFWVASEETLNLYLFTLSLYQLAMEIAKVIWEGRNAGFATMEMSSTKAIEGELSERVVWIRDQFNGCLEKAEVASGWMSEAEAAWLNAQQELASARGVEFRVVVPPSARTAEKIIYDRALQLSRGAADEEVRQMSGAESGESEGSANLHLAEEMYTTAMVLLEALLIAPPSWAGGGGNISDDDRGVVESVFGKLYTRMEIVQRLIEGGRTTSAGGTDAGV
ncbi:hypothetical protein BJ742DRAFT_788937 [Cladochytrium replicatum]|nr:hypothetical protein BJ742DRAFT_788937 [Cladochytrium replicatum]